MNSSCEGLSPSRLRATRSPSWASGSCSAARRLRSSFGSAALSARPVSRARLAETSPTAQASLLAGSYRTRRGAAKFGGEWGSLNAIGELSHFETDGYRDHSAAQREHLNTKLRLGLGEASSGSLASFKKAGLPSRSKIGMVIRCPFQPRR